LIKSGDFGKGYVHVLSEREFEDLLTELDTITTMVGFLSAKEAYFSAGYKSLVVDPKNKILGYYLLNYKSFHANVALLLIDDTLWDGLAEREDFRWKKKVDTISFDCDRLIELYVGRNRELVETPDE